MKHKSHESTALGALGAAIGKGLIAGCAGTIAMTISQKIEMKLTGRKPSQATVKQLKKFCIFILIKMMLNKFSNEIHYSYGSVNGVLRGFLSLAGITGFAATSLHLASYLGNSHHH